MNSNSYISHNNNMNIFSSNTTNKWRYEMQKNQEINCTVTSCKYNNKENAKCILQSIQVEPIMECETMEADESMCASYEHLEE